MQPPEVSSKPHAVLQVWFCRKSGFAESLDRCGSVEFGDRAALFCTRGYFVLAESFVAPFDPPPSYDCFRRPAASAKKHYVTMIIAIDGPAASGKGTIAKQVAAIYGLHHLDTGLIYRAVAKAVLDAGHSPDNVNEAIEAAIALDPKKFDEGALKAQAITEAASVVAAIPEVRQALMNYQREFATRPPGAVLDGRDIGTVIAPGADVKLFVVATPEVRAARRAIELKARGEPADEQEVLADLLRRDERDSRRTAAPLKAAPDAHLLDTTHLGIDAAFRAAVDIIEAVRTGRKRG